MKDIRIRRDYQNRIIEQVKSKFAEGHSEVVVASPPGSGKTYIASEIIKEFGDSNFLILAHGTLVLKDQWLKELEEAGLSHSDQIGKERVCCNIPQALRNKKKENVDFLIVDEAHQFTHANMVQNLIKEIQPKHIIYLTATPSRFVLLNYEILTVSVKELIEAGVLNDLYIGLISTNVHLDSEDRNNFGDIRRASEYKLEESVDDDLDRLLEAMHIRLTEVGLLKSSPVIRKTKEKIRESGLKLVKGSSALTNVINCISTMGVLHKTMVACASIDQSKKVLNYFNKKGVLAISSESQSDPNCENILKFKEDPDIKVLVVVDRGVLGFNMPELVNVIDLTGTHNIDRIYQLFCRVVRVHKDHPTKFYFKICSEEENAVTSFFMTASLMLTNPEILKRYNGKNLHNLKIPVLKKTSPRGHFEGGGKSRSKTELIPIDLFFSIEVGACKYLNHIENIIGNVGNEYAYVTLREAITKHRDIRIPIDIAKFENLSKNDLMIITTKIIKNGLTPDEAYEEWRNDFCQAA